MMPGMFVAAPLELRDGDGARLRALIRSPLTGITQVVRARMLLMAAAGMSNDDIAEQIGVPRPTVVTLRVRYGEHGMEVLKDRGRPPRANEATVVAASLDPPPVELGVGYWSARLMADYLRRNGIAVSLVEVARIWREWGLHPRHVRTFMFPTDPPLPAEIADMVGLCLDPPVNAVVVCLPVVSSTRISSEALGKRCARHDAALDLAPLVATINAASDGVTADECHLLRGRDGALLTFLKQVAKAHPRASLHVISDRDVVRDYPRVEAWLLQNSRIEPHRLPAGVTFQSMVEAFVKTMIRPVDSPGVFTGVDGLGAAICRFIDTHDERSDPFTWIKKTGPGTGLAQRVEPV
jgi:transposase